VTRANLQPSASRTSGGLLRLNTRNVVPQVVTESAKVDWRMLILSYVASTVMALRSNLD
jgi:hypothetical protein